MIAFVTQWLDSHVSHNELVWIYSATKCMHGIISKYLSNLLVTAFITHVVLFPDCLICVKSSAGVNQNVERLECFYQEI